MKVTFIESLFVIFQLATKGKVKQLSDICYANPDRLRARDRKAANVLHHAAGAGQAAVIEFVTSFPGGEERKFVGVPLVSSFWSESLKLFQVVM